MAKIQRTGTGLLHNVPLKATVYAVCEVWSYGVWGNHRDGWNVNNRFCVARKAVLPVEVSISNVPETPGRNNAPSCGSFSKEVVFSYSLRQRDLKAYFGKSARFSGEGDDLSYYVERASGYPLGKVQIIGWATGEEGADTVPAKY